MYGLEYFLVSFWVSAYFQGRTVSFREWTHQGTKIFDILPGEKENQHVPFTIGDMWSF